MNDRLWLFSSATEREAAFPAGEPEGLSIATAGVGLIDAGIAAAEAIQRFAPKEIVYLGTCGAYRGGDLTIGSVVVARNAVLGSGDVVRRHMRLPTIIPDVVQCDTKLVDRVSRQAGRADLPRVAVVCTLGITEDNELADDLSNLGDVENMELYAIIRAAASIPVGALLGVTNIVGKGGGFDWRAHYRETMASLGAMLRLA